MQSLFYVKKHKTCTAFSFYFTIILYFVFLYLHKILKFCGSKVTACQTVQEMEIVLQTLPTHNLFRQLWTKNEWKKNTFPPTRIRNIVTELSGEQEATSQRMKLLWEERKLH